MQIRLPGATVTLNDSDPRVAKIKSGCAYSLVDGELVVEEIATKPNFSSYLSKLKNKQAGLPELNEIVELFLSKYIENGKL